jgi:hypothetical protein
VPVPTDYGLEISFAHNIHFQTPLLMEHHIHQLMKNLLEYGEEKWEIWNFIQEN